MVQSALLPSIALLPVGDSAATSPPSTAPCLYEAERVYKSLCCIRGERWERAEAEHRDLVLEDMLPRSHFDKLKQQTLMTMF